jgi:hypothetical protein
MLSSSSKLGGTFGRKMLVALLSPVLDISDTLSKEYGDALPIFLRISSFGEYFIVLMLYDEAEATHTLSWKPPWLLHLMEYYD